MTAKIKRLPTDRQLASEYDISKNSTIACISTRQSFDHFINYCNLGKEQKVFTRVTEPRDCEGRRFETILVLADSRDRLSQYPYVLEMCKAHIY